MVPLVQRPDHEFRMTAALFDPDSQGLHHVVPGLFTSAPAGAVPRHLGAQLLGHLVDLFQHRLVAHRAGKGPGHLSTEPVPEHRIPAHPRGQLRVGVAEAKELSEIAVVKHPQIQIHQGVAQNFSLCVPVKTHVGAVEIKVAAVHLDDTPGNHAVDVQVLRHIGVVVGVGQVVMEGKAIDLRKVSLAVPGALPLGHGVGVCAGMLGVVMGGMGFADVVQAPVFPVDVQYRRAVILPGEFGKGIPRQLMHHIVAQVAGLAALLIGAEKDGRKLRNAVIEQIVPQHPLIAAAETELERFKSTGVTIHTSTKVTPDLFNQLEKDFDAIVLAIGGHNPVVIPFEGYERLIKGLNFLKDCKNGKKYDLGKKVVVIGAGNAAMDVITEVYKQDGIESVTAIDIQEPSAFEKEIKAAEKLGAKIMYPCFTQKITDKGVLLKDGRFLEADSVIISVGDRPIFDFVPKDYLDEKSRIQINEFMQTPNPKVFAIGDAIKPGLFTNAIADGKHAAENIVKFLNNEELTPIKEKDLIPAKRIKSEYYECYSSNCDNEQNRCMSCGYCRDCGLCKQ